MRNLEPIIGQHFAFAHGRIGVLQQLMLTQSDLDRLLGCHDGTEAERILTELKLTNLIDQGISGGTAILQALAAWVRAEVDTMTPKAKKPIFNILWLEGDAPVLSYLLKAKLQLTSEVSEEPLSGMTAYDPEALKTFVNENRSGNLPEHLVRFVQEVLTGEKPDARTIDTHVAAFVAQLRLRLARTSGSPAILHYVQHIIDLQNIRTALRLDQTEESDTKYLLEGGTIEPNELTGSMRDIQAAIDRSPIAFTLTEDLISTSEDPGALERAFSHVLARDIAEMWNIPMGLEPAFAFAATAVSQLKLLRVLLIGKRNGLTPQEIKQALPPFLSASHYVL